METNKNGTFLNQDIIDQWIKLAEIDLVLLESIYGNSHHVSDVADQVMQTTV